MIGGCSTCTATPGNGAIIDTKTFIKARYTRERQGLLGQANLTLEVLRFQMRLAKDLQCLKVKSYGRAAKTIDEIGRLVGAWLKSGHKP